MKILLINQDWFKEELRVAGHEVVSCGADQHFDIRVAVSFIHWNEVISLCPWTPDAVAIFDNSIPLFIAHLDTVEVPIIFYSVDVHHHINWQKSFRRFFDHLFVAQKDFLPSFEEGSAPVQWLPLWAHRVTDPVTPKIYEAVFVGTLNPSLNPDRVAFFDELKSIAPVSCVMGEYWHIYPPSKVIINQTVKGDLNFRVFEALASGVALVTERTTNGLLDLFTDGIHLLCYEKGDPKDAAAKIQKLLTDDDLRNRIASAGKQAIKDSHLSSHRAAAILTTLSMRKQINRSCYALIDNFVALGLYLETQNRTPKYAFTEAMRLIDSGIAKNESMTFEIGQSILQALTHADRILQDSHSQSTLELLTKRYPQWFNKK